MMNQSDAAKLLIVAWKKNWSTRSLASTIICAPFNDIACAELLRPYKFMSDDSYVYLGHRGKGMKVRPYVAQYLPRVNNFLWDNEKDIPKLLQCATLIQKTKAILHTSKGRRKETTELLQLARSIGINKKAYSEKLEDHSRRAWSTCKGKP